MTYEDTSDPCEARAYRLLQRRYRTLQRRESLDPRDPDALDEDEYEHIQTMKEHLEDMF